MRSAEGLDLLYRHRHAVDLRTANVCSQMCLIPLGRFNFVAVAAFVLSGLALAVSLVALLFSVRSDRRDAERRHEEQTPSISAEWDDARVVLTLLSAPDGGLDSASVHLADAVFAGASEGQRAPFDEELGHPWPIGYRWELPQIEDGPARRVHVVVACRSRDRQWSQTVVVDVPSTEFFVY